MSWLNDFRLLTMIKLIGMEKFLSDIAFSNTSSIIFWHSTRRFLTKKRVFSFLI